MKFLSQTPPRPPQPRAEPPKVDKQVFVKRNMAQRADRSQQVKDALEQWLLSFNGGITKKDFELQLCRLEQDDDKALKQLEGSLGKRKIQLLPREKPPKLPAKVISVLATHKMIAVEGKSGKKIIDDFLSTLPSGGVYILNVNELILEYVDYQHRGKAGEIIEQANRSDILVIEGLEKPISLPYHIKDTLYQLAEVRARAENKYTISTWNYTHAWYIKDYADMFVHFSA